MQAIILAAGMGKRLGEYTKNNTKCMVKVNGIPLIDRLLKQLSTLGLNRVVIVVGYEGQKLVNYVGKEKNGLKIEYICNPIYDKTNNIYSLALAKEKMQEDDTLLVESDLIFQDGMFELLLNNPQPNLALVAKYEPWMDGTMVKLGENNNIVQFIPKKSLNFQKTDHYYKTVNIYKLSREFCIGKYIPFLEAYTKSAGTNEYYETVLRIISFLDNSDLKALPITTEKWYEIDDKQDLDIAEALFADNAEILHKYHKRYGGFWRFPKLLDYCYLVNPFFMSSKIVDELEANFRTLLCEYPSGMDVNSLLASKCWGVKENYILPGNGASELIKNLMENINGRMGITRPTFEEYPNRLTEKEIEAFIPSDESFRYTANELIDYFSKHPIDNLLLINPDNPSGNYIPKHDLLAIADWCEKKEIRFVLDESFVDFCDQWETSSMLENKILESHPHMIVIKSISKSYGVPGLRLGILASADETLIKNMKKQVSIWNINSFAEYFMQIYSKYDSDYKRACDEFVQERERFMERLKSIPYLKIMPSQANFFMCEVLPPYTASTLASQLLSKFDILISNCSAKKGLEKDKYIRIAIKSDIDNDKFINALKQL